MTKINKGKNIAEKRAQSNLSVAMLGNYNI